MEKIKDYDPWDTSWDTSEPIGDYELTDRELERMLPGPSKLPWEDDPPRKMIRQMVKFDDINSPERKRITAEIFIDKDKNLFKFRANDYVSLATFAKVVSGIKQIRYIANRKRKLCRIIGKNSIEFCIKKNIHYDGSLELYDLETVIEVKGSVRTQSFSVKERTKERTTSPLRAHS